MGTTDTQIPNLDKVVGELLSKHTTEDGKLALPEDIDPQLAYAVRAEKKFRDTQGAYTKSQQANKVLKTEAETLRELVSGSTQVQLTDSQLEELDTLKLEDPDKWRVQLNQYEAQARDQAAEQLTKVQQDAEIAARKGTLEAFNQFQKDNGLKPITGEVIANEVPPRLVRQLEAGEVSFDNFLQQVATYVGTPKAFTGKEGTLNQPSLSDAAGGTHPTDPKPEDVQATYSSAIF